jgi:hypothetical protein
MKLIKPMSIILPIILLVTSFCLARVPTFSSSMKEYDFKNIEHFENQHSNNALNEVAKYNVSFNDNEILLPLIDAIAKIMDNKYLGDYYEDQ